MGVVLSVPNHAFLHDPATATSSVIHASILARTETKNHHKAVAPYLTWRFCLMLCGSICWVIAAMLSWPGDAKESYQGFLNQIPDTLYIDKTKFESLVDALTAFDFILYGVDILAMLLFMAGTCCALPQFALDSFQRSRALGYASWLTCFLPLFLVFLFFPFRTLVPWAELSEDVCYGTIKATFNLPGSQLKYSLGCPPVIA